MHGTLCLYLLAVHAVLLLAAAPSPSKIPLPYLSHFSAQGKLYVGIASTPGVQNWGRTLNRSLGDVLYGTGVAAEALPIELPANGSFSGRLLENLCKRLEGHHLAALLVLGDSPAAALTVLAANYAGVPVLWAQGKAAGFRAMETHPLEVHLAPTGREYVLTLRALLLQAHWHTYTLLVEATFATALQRGEMLAALSDPPLHPTIISLPSPHREQIVFRKLADIARSTRGVVVLLCEQTVAKRILGDARRLNMLDGHFVWIWIDTVPNHVRSNATLTEDPRDTERKKRSSPPIANPPSPARTPISSSSSSSSNPLSDMHIDHLLRNDASLLLEKSEPAMMATSSKAIRSQPPEKRWSSSGGAEQLWGLPAGLLSVRSLPLKLERHVVRGAVRLLAATLKMALERTPEWGAEAALLGEIRTSCWRTLSPRELNLSRAFARELRNVCNDALSGTKYTQENSIDKLDKSLVSNFEVLNLVPERTTKEDGSLNRTDADVVSLKWKRVGMISGRSIRLDTIVWPGGDLSVADLPSRARNVFRVVTALAPPFVMETEVNEDGQCLRGLPCHRVLTSDKDNLTLVFNEMELKERLVVEAGADVRPNQQYKHYGHAAPNYVEENGKVFPFSKFKYKTNCCYGLSMDLLENIAHDLEFDFRLYVVADGLFGTKVATKKRKRKRDVGKQFLSYRFKQEIHNGQSDLHDETEEEMDVRWNGVVGDLVSETAHMSFAALSVSSARSEVIDFSVPYFFSGVSFLADPQQKSEIPLMAFLLPFSPELWIAIFTSLNITAIAVAIYEWLSPFGLNPWGRQRSKNFSMSSALWVMWGLLCGHLVAFKAPKSWPNKFLINVWGGFSVIFVASYTANIAALIAGLFFHNTVSNYHDRSLLSQKVGAPKASAAEYYVQRTNRMLWEHMRRYALENVEDGILKLRNGSLDILIADTPILDYYRATDQGCKLQKIGDTINEDTYAVGMTKGFPLKNSISAIIAKYSNNGYMDILQEKWYGDLPCFKLGTEALAQPKPLGVEAVAGVFLLLGVGMALGCLILLVEHLFFRYTLPILREKPKGSIWRSRNIMFFSQKLYRFINCVELVSPHHAARELVHTIRQGQITSLFQKSVKRKEHEQRRRRRSKAQFFEMIQEIRSTIRRQQQEERERPLEAVTEADSELGSPVERRPSSSPSILKRTFLRTSPKSENAPRIRSPTSYFGKQLFSPRAKTRSRSPGSLNVRRFSTDSVFSQTLKADRSTAVGRRLSKDATFLSGSPPDINSRRSSYLDTISTGTKIGGKSPVLSIENVSDIARPKEPLRKLSDSESIGKKLATLPKYNEPMGKHHRLQPQYSLNVGKSEEILNKSDVDVARYNTLPDNVKLAKSYQNICDGVRESCTTSTLNFPLEQKNNLSDDEIARRNRLTINQLHTQMHGQLTAKPPVRKTRSNSHAKGNNPQPPRIQVEDTSNPELTNGQQQQKDELRRVRRSKTRHQSLGDAGKVLDVHKKNKNRLTEHSRSLDGNPPRESSRSRSHSPRYDDLPPAPPPPNCSPRNSDGGRSPLTRLSKDELVNLWRSSESELRSHLLKAIRDKESDDPP